MAEHDSSYKLLFSFPEMVADLLRGFVHEPWVSQVDFSTLERVKTSAVSDDLRERVDDIIWRVRLGDRWLYIYILLEFQSTVEWFMAVRIMTYVGLLYQDLIRSGQVDRRRGLPPVFPVVLYNGEGHWTAPDEIGDLIHDAPAGLEPYRPKMRYLLLAENAYGDAQLEPHHNLAAALFRLENSRSLGDVRRVLDILIRWLGQPEQEGLRRAFTAWMSRVLLPRRLPGVEVPDLGDLQEVNTMLAERVQEWTKEWREAGMEEGRKEGRKEGREEGREEGRHEGRHEGRQHATRELLLDVIEIRFDHVPEDVHAAISGIEDPVRLTQLHRAAIQVGSLDEIRALLQAGASNPDP